MRLGLLQRCPSEESRVDLVQGIHGGKGHECVQRAPIDGPHEPIRVHLSVTCTDHGGEVRFRRFGRNEFRRDHQGENVR
ncbi:hypothetical protein AB0I28_12570 [Phytomonospora sp. NPDC050363]|uniref:hypothetical protein n=1 Tax=Phytomonospora sp. NPDC050363 TaxID=3155642 RepID=UPI0034046FA0